MTQRREKQKMFKRIRMATALTLIGAVSLAMLLGGCSGDKSSSLSTTSTDQTLNRVTGPVGSVTGQVLDTNGVAIPGAVVGVAGQTTTTNALGQYYFKNVQVTFAAGADQGYQGYNVLVVKINAPAGYLGATVTVDVAAQFDGSNDYTGNGAGNDVVAEGNNKTVTLVDGFLAQAGDAVLAKLSVTVTGWLRNCNTGEPVGNQTVALDLRSVNFHNALPHPDGTELSFESQIYSAATGSDGKFVITGVPADSTLAYNIPDYDFNASTVTTADEAGVIVNDGQICVTKITSSDSIQPKVARVTPIIGEAVCFDCDPNNQDGGTATDYRAILKRGVDGTAGIQVVFTEAMASTIDPAAIILRNTTKNTYIPADKFTATMAGNTLTITLAADVALSPGDKLDVILARADFTDLSGNMLSASDTVGYDYAFGAGAATGCGSSADCIPFIKLCLVAYQEPNTILGTVTGVQVCDVGDGSLGHDADLDAAYAGVFTDCCNNYSGYQQLNGGHNDGAFGSIADIDDQDDTATILSNLGSALTGSTIDVSTDWASVKFTPAPNVDTYLISIPSGSSFRANCDTPSNICAQEVFTGIAYVADTTKDATFGVSGVSVGEKVKITPVDDFGYQGTAFTVTLNDCAKPTIALQTAYGVCNTSEGVAALVAYGAGAELSDEGSAGQFAHIIYPVTPRMLGRQEAVPYSSSTTYTPATPIPADGLVEPITIWDLYTRDTVCDTTTNDCQYASGDVANINLAFARTDVYDAHAFDSYLPSRRLGLAVTEDLGSINTASFAYNGTVTLNNWAFLNDVYRQDTYQANTPRADLVLFDASNILNFANVDHGSIIDATGALVDLFGNVSDDLTTTDLNLPSGASNAKVVVYDRMPPFVDRAYIADADANGQNSLYIEFNEPILNPAQWQEPTVRLLEPANQSNACVVRYDATDTANWSLSVDRKTLRIDTDSPFMCGGSFISGTWFPTTSAPIHAVYAESDYNDLATAGSALPHGILSWGFVQDDHHNAWSNWTGGINPPASTTNPECASIGNIVNAPVFGVVNAEIIAEINQRAIVTPAWGDIGTITTTDGLTGNFTVTWTITGAAPDWYRTFATAIDAAPPLSSGTTLSDYNTVSHAIANCTTWFGVTDNGLADLGAVYTCTANAVGSVLTVAYNITNAGTASAGNASLGMRTPNLLTPTNAPAGFEGMVFSTQWIPAFNDADTTLRAKVTETLGRISAQ